MASPALNTLLIVPGPGDSSASSNPGRHNRKSLTAAFPQRRSFLRRRHHAVQPGGFGEPGETNDLFQHR
jgi:hypothetical protein